MEKKVESKSDPEKELTLRPSGQESTESTVQLLIRKAKNRKEDHE